MQLHAGRVLAKNTARMCETEETACDTPEPGPRDNIFLLKGCETTYPFRIQTPFERSS